MVRAKFTQCYIFLISYKKYPGAGVYSEGKKCFIISELVLREWLRERG